MEEGHVHTMLLADLQDLLHRHMQFPGGGKLSCILHGVGVAQHDFLAALNVILVPRHAKGGVDHLRSIDQVVARLEEGADTHELLHAADLLQQAHSQDIRSSPGHGNAVGAQGLDGQLRDGLVGGQDFLNDVAAFEIVGQEGPLRFDLLHEPVAFLLLGPRSVFPQAQELRDRLQSLGVTVTFLAHVQASHADAEGADTADEIQESAVGHGLIATLDQGAVDDLQWPSQLVHGGENLLLEVWLRVAAHVHGLHGLLRSPAAPSQGHQKPPVGLVGGHARVEVPMHTAALVRAANLASGHRRGRPHAADSLDLPLKLLAGLTRHAQLVEQLIHLAVVQLNDAPAKQRHHLLGRLPRHIGIAITISSHPAAQLQNRRTVRKLRLANSPQAAVDAAVVLRHRLPDSVLDDQHAIARFSLRSGPGASHRVRAPAAPLHSLDIIIEALQLSWCKRVFAVVPLQVGQHVLVLLQGTSPLGFRRVSRQDQLNLLSGQSLADLLGLYSFCHHLLQQSLPGEAGEIALVVIMRHHRFEGSEAVMRLRQVCLERRVHEDPARNLQLTGRHLGHVVGDLLEHCLPLQAVLFNHVHKTQDLLRQDRGAFALTGCIASPSRPGRADPLAALLMSTEHRHQVRTQHLKVPEHVCRG
mmetsp:Transcript_17779/g.36700  ORF Transcript_17779/g.36700 Transcript_17779/m.36700 type:complete len:642 (+) Transcript_17779:975-2900(+)